MDNDFETEPPIFGGKPGEPVREVDPEDVKTVWQVGKDAEAGHPGVATGFDAMKHIFKPGVDIQAVGYRSMLIRMMSQIAPVQLKKFMREGKPNDSVFRAAAKVPLEWMGVGIVREGPPFDVNEFLKLCGETA
jgi:hypothetical protein